MSKKLITACMALFALAAFALPATAAATNDPDVTHPTGTLMKTHNPAKSCTEEPQGCIDAHNLGPVYLKDAAGNTLTECTTSTFTGYLTKNDGSNAEGNIESSSFSGTGAGGKCTSNFGDITVHTNIGNGTPWCLRSTSTMVTHEVQVRGGRCSEEARPITFVLTSGIGTCKYSRSGALKGTYTTHSTGDAILTFTSAGETGKADSEFTKEEGGIFCPTAGRLQGAWTLQTDTEITDPIYIS